MGSNELKAATHFFSTIDACAQCGSDKIAKFLHDDEYFASLTDSVESSPEEKK